MSGPNTKAFANLKSAKKGSELSAIGRGCLQIGQFRLPAFIFSNDELEDTLLGLDPLTAQGCTAIFTHESFHLYYKSNPKPILSGSKTINQKAWKVQIQQPTITDDTLAPHVPSAFGVTLQNSRQTDSEYVQFVHASLGFPSPTTFMNAVRKGYINGPNQYTRLTSKLVAKHMPNAMATARGHLDRVRMGQPHVASQSVSALKRLHMKIRSNPASSMKPGDKTTITPFDATSVPKSRTLHMDYTGQLPIACSSGVQYFQIACWGHYINIQGLTSLRAAQTTKALTAAVNFFREHEIILETLRMDNQRSLDLQEKAEELKLTIEYIAPEVKRPNRAERAIRTAKNHIIATRAGFHPDFSHIYLDKCLPQMELALNIIHPFEYDETISAYQGIYNKTFNFKHHPIAPLGCKVLTWDSPDNRGSWADHGIEAMYTGPALDHFRSFDIWIPSNSASRVSNTVWWFMTPIKPDQDLLRLAPEIAYPPTRDRPNPQDNGADLLGRHFVEPEIGVCCITDLGPIIHKAIDTRADRNQRIRLGAEPPIPAGAHYTLCYRQLLTGAEHISSVTEVINWIKNGPILQPPTIVNPEVTGIPPNATTPLTTTTLQYVPIIQQSTDVRIESIINSEPSQLHPEVNESEIAFEEISHEQCATTRTSNRNRKTRDFLQPKFHGKVYTVKEKITTPGKQRVSVNKQIDSYDEKWYLRPMPKSTLPPAFPTGPLNLNTDGTKINYKKSHTGPWKIHWDQADAEEIVRLLTSETIRPLHFFEIPTNKVVTYVNPVCVEKLNDDGSLKFRTRLTIGGDRIIYPYDKSAVTADLESFKLLVNCMISEDAQWTTIDLTDFYLGTPLPHPEYIRIPTSMIPERVVKFYNLTQFVNSKAIYFSVHRTHYGLPQAGALSQQRLFKHLEKNGYTQCPNTPSFFRNHDGSVRFSLVVDDFAILWTKQKSIDHFITTLRQLYSVKINWEGTKYIGMNIDINRKERHVTLSMAGYIDKLLQEVRPEGIKSAKTPAIYFPPNHKKPGAQTATIDDSPAATEEQKKELQSIIGTLLYYSRTVDPSILTAVHELGSNQAKPTIMDMRKMERVLQYLSIHKNYGV